MKKISPILIIAFCLVSIFSSSIFAQTNPSNDWMRVQSDDGEFSTEIPKSSGFFYDKDGFVETVDSGDSLQLKQMNTFNAFYNKTLISVETYETSNPKKAANVFQEREKSSAKYSDVQRNNFRIKQMISKTGDYYLIRQIFVSKSHLYVLTAASREGETPALKYFLESLVFNLPGQPVSSPSISSAAKTYLFSTIKPYALAIDLNPPPPNSSGSPAPDAPKDDTIRPIVFFLKPRAAYTNAARQSLERGIIRLRIDCSENGLITKISVLKSLQSGLLRQAIFAALRTKFVPQEKDGNPVTVTKTLEYSFDIY